MGAYRPQSRRSSTLDHWLRLCSPRSVKALTGPIRNPKNRRALVSTSHPGTDRDPLRRLRRALQAVVLSATLGVAATACSSDLFGDSGGAAPAPSSTPSPIVKVNNRSVRSFYALASEAYRTRDADALCTMTQPAYATAMVEQAVAAGLRISTCQELWHSAFAVDPDGYMDPLTDIVVNGKSATFRSGDDPWRVQLVRGEMKIVAPKK